MIHKKINLDNFLYLSSFGVFILIFIFTLNYLFPSFTQNTLYYANNAISVSFNNNKLDSQEMINYINNSTNKNLDNEKKNYLANKELFDDILKVSTRRRYFYLRRNLNDFGIEYFNDNEKNNKTIGYYTVITPNRIHLLDDSIETFYNTSAHEFIHLLQSNSKYTYINEASAEIMAYEYYNSYPASYKDARKRLYVLMEIIGSDSIFECNFSGSCSNLENEIYNYLGKNDGDKLLKLFTTTPINQNSIKNNKEIDYFLAEMYKNSDKENTIKYIYDNDNIYKIYFNKNSRNYSNNDIYLEDDNRISYNSYEITEDEYKINGNGSNFYKRRSIITNNRFYDIENVGILEISTGIIHDYDEALINGYVDNYKYYKLAYNERNYF